MISAPVQIQMCFNNAFQKKGLGFKQQQGISKCIGVVRQLQKISLSQV